MEQLDFSDSDVRQAYKMTIASQYGYDLSDPDVNGLLDEHIDSITPLPPEKGFIRETFDQGIAGAVIEVPRTIGKALQYSGEPGDTRYEIGKNIEARATEAERNTPWLKPTATEASPVKRAFSGGAKMIGTSLAVPAFVGLAASTLPVSATTATLLASGLGVIPMAMAQGQDTLDKAKKAGISYDEAVKAARGTALIEWGGEAVAGYAGLKFLGFGGRLLSKFQSIPAAEKVAISILKEISDTSVVPRFLKALGQTYLAEIGTEIGQAGGQAAIEQSYGIDKIAPYAAAKSVIGPTAAMTTLLAPFGVRAAYRQAAQNTTVNKLLNDTTADPEQRIAAARLVYDQLKEVDQEAAKNWAANATIAITGEQSISLDKKFINKPEEAIFGIKSPTDSKLPEPKTYKSLSEVGSDLVTIQNYGESAIQQVTPTPEISDEEAARFEQEARRQPPPDLMADIIGSQEDVQRQADERTVAMQRQDKAWEQQTQKAMEYARERNQIPVSEVFKRQYQESILIPKKNRGKAVNDFIKFYEARAREEAEYQKYEPGTPVSQEIELIGKFSEQATEEQRQADQRAQKVKMQRKYGAGQQANEILRQEAQLEEEEQRDFIDPELEKFVSEEAEKLIRSNPFYGMMAEIKKRGGINKDGISKDYDLDTIRALNKKYPGLIVSLGKVQADEFADEQGFRSLDEMMQAFLSTPSMKAEKAKNIASMRDEWSKAEEESKQAQQEPAISKTETAPLTKGRIIDIDGTPVKYIGPQVIGDKVHSHFFNDGPVTFASPDTSPESVKKALSEAKARFAKPEAATTPTTPATERAPGGLIAPTERPEEKVGKQKEPWEMTQKEYVDGIYRSPGMHKEGVRLALERGEQVPSEVLADYPDLKPAGALYQQYEPEAPIVGKGQEIESQAQDAATSPLNDIPQPTEAQKKAGNYQKGHVTLHGLDISIENPAGSKREGVDKSGKKWSQEMKHHYGYFKGTVGPDKDHVDVFLGKNPEDSSLPVFVIDQVDPVTRKFDEPKVIMGEATEDEARQTYLANYEPGWKGIGSVTEMGLDDFKEWVKDPAKTAKKTLTQPSVATVTAPSTEAKPATAEKPQSEWRDGKITESEYIEGKRKAKKQSESAEPEPKFSRTAQPSGHYPRVNDARVSGLLVRSHIPNTDSIAAGYSNENDYEVLPGVREVLVADFPGASAEDMFYSVEDHKRVKELAEKIKESGEINPLIVVIDEEGPYILEGGHRLAALESLGKKTFPALVVIEAEGINYSKKIGAQPSGRTVQQVAQAVSKNARAKKAMEADRLKVVQTAAELPDGSVPLYMTAWHGSPHRFDKFSAEHIGKGEGAQAYGYGLYFADKREVAEFYRNKLQSVGVKLDGKSFKSGKSFEKYLYQKKDIDENIANTIAGMIFNFGLQHTKEEASYSQNQFQELSDSAKTESGKNSHQQTSDEYQKVVNVLAQTQSSGTLYEVELAPAEEEFLLFDASLSSLTGSAKAAILKRSPDRIARTANNLGNITESEPFVSKGFGGLDIPTQRRVLELVSRTTEDDKVLNAVVEAIPVDVMDILFTGNNLSPEVGLHDENMLKYLFSATPNKPVPSRVDRAVTSLVRIVTSHAAKSSNRAAGLVPSGKNDSAMGAGIGVSLHERIIQDIGTNASGNVFYQRLSKELGSAKAASDYLHSLGIRGIKYLDGTSRGKDGYEQHNYVIFSDKDVSIKAKYSRQGQVAGAYYADTDTMYLVADGIMEGQELPTAFHEAFHREVDLGKLQPILDELGRLEKMAGKKGVVADWFAKAREAAQVDKDSPHYAEEIGAYAVQQYEQSPNTIKRWVDKLVAKVKYVLFRTFGVMPKTLDPAFLREIAINGLRGGVVKDSFTTGTMFSRMAKDFGITAAEAKKQYEDVVARFKGTDGWMKAPNGEPTKLNERQWVQVQTPAFKEWFGDYMKDRQNSSKVVDSNGEPLVVYHISSRDIIEFKPGGDNPSASGKAMWFGSKKHRGELPAYSASSASKNAGTYPVFLKIVDPLTIRSPEQLEQVNKDFGGRKTDFPLLISDKQLDTLKGWDADGVLLSHESLTSGVISKKGGPIDEYITFSPNQIKSSIGNTGQFSPSDDIRYARTAAVEKEELDTMEVEMRDRWHKGKADINKFNRWFETIEKYARKVPTVARYWDAIRDRRDLKVQYENEQFNVGGMDYVKEADALSRKNHKAYSDYMIERDATFSEYTRRKNADGSWTAYTPGKTINGKKVSTKTKFEGKDAEDKATQHLFDTEHARNIADGMSKTVADIIRTSRMVYYAGLKMSIGTLITAQEEARRAGVEEPTIGITVQGAKFKVTKKNKEDGRAFRLFKNVEDARDFINSRNNPGEWVHNELETPEVQEQLTIDEVINKIGDLVGNYFPRKRAQGDVVLRAYDKKGNETYMKMFDIAFKEDWEKGKGIESLKKMVNFGVGKFQKYLIGAEDLHGTIREMKKKGWRVEISDNTQLPEDVFEAKKLMVSMQNLLDEALKAASAEKQEAAKELNKILTVEIAKLFIMRGSLSSRLKRREKVIAGYETDAIKATISHVKGIAGGMAKRETSERAMKIILGRDISWDDYKAKNPDAEYKKDYMKLVDERRIDPGKQKEAYGAVMSNFEWSMRNQTKLDRVVGTLKGLAVLKFLGFRISSPAVNMTAMLTNVPAEMHSKGISFAESAKHLTKASAAYVGKRSFRDKGIFNYIHKKGWDAPQFNQDAAGFLMSQAGRGYDYIISKAMWLFGVTEKMNRAVTIAASYTAMGGKVDLNGKVDVALMKKARNISDEAHGVYQKETIPEMAMGEGLPAAALRTSYTFMKFTHNYLSNVKKYGFSTERDLKAMTWLLLSPAILAGTSASVVSTLAFAIARGLGCDDPEEDFYAWVEENVGLPDRFTRQGIAGLAGVDIKGSLGIRWGVPTTMKELLGAPYAVVEDTVIGAKKIAGGETGKGIEKILPTGLSSPLKALREYNEGVTTESNKRVFGEDDQPLKGSWVDAVTRALTFNPAGLAAEREKLWHGKIKSKMYAGEKSKIYSDMRKYLLSENRNIADWTELLLRVDDYNMNIIGNDDKEIITESTIKSLIKQMRVVGAQERMKTAQAMRKFKYYERKIKFERKKQVREREFVR